MLSITLSICIAGLDIDSSKKNYVWVISQTTRKSKHAEPAKRTVCGGYAVNFTTKKAQAALTSRFKLY
jgi:hypothetical protein